MSDQRGDPGGWYRPASVHLDAYNDAWPDMYRAEADRVTAALRSDLVAIEHVGSTAVPGLPAKPILDILAAVSTWDRFEEVVSRLGEIGYLYTPESEADDPGRRVFRKGPRDMSLMRTHHLHVTAPDSPYWRRIVAFRDQLREDAAYAAEYAALKRRLAGDFSTDSRGYTRAKTQFVKRMEAKRGSGPEPEDPSDPRPTRLGDRGDGPIIVFDLFGTLVPQFPRVQHDQLLVECSKIVGLDPDLCQHVWRDLYVARITGQVSGIAGHLTHVAENQGVALGDDRLADACGVYRRFVRGMLIPTDDARDALKILRARRARIGLLSNAHTDVADAFQETELAPSFAAAIFSCHIGSKKPERPAFAAVAQAMGTSGGTIVMFVGDGSDDELAGAAAAGMRPVLLRGDLTNAYDDVRPHLDAWGGEEVRRLTDLVELMDSNEYPQTVDQVP